MSWGGKRTKAHAGAAGGGRSTVEGEAFEFSARRGAVVRFEPWPRSRGLCALNAGSKLWGREIGNYVELAYVRGSGNLGPRFALVPLSLAPYPTPLEEDAASSPRPAEIIGNAVLVSFSSVGRRYALGGYVARSDVDPTGRRKALAEAREEDAPRRFPGGAPFSASERACRLGAPYRCVFKGGHVAVRAAPSRHAPAVGVIEEGQLVRASRDAPDASALAAAAPGEDWVRVLGPYLVRVDISPALGQRSPRRRGEPSSRAGRGLRRGGCRRSDGGSRVSQCRRPRNDRSGVSA